MRLVRPFREARELLGLQANASPEDLKRAWRRAAATHPPDGDPEAFRKVRGAYELLLDPLGSAQNLLYQPTSNVEPPVLPPPPPAPPPHALALELFRAVVNSLPASVFLERPAVAAASRKREPRGA